jgi:6-phosphogluconolactonase
MRLHLFAFLFVIAMAPSRLSSAKDSVVWIGMERPALGQREGIYRAELDEASGALTLPKLAAEVGAPEFLAMRPDGKRMYAACRLKDGKPGVAAFEVSDDHSSLKFLNSQPIGDGGACHLATDRTGRCLFTAQYGTGSVAVFPLAADGHIEPRSALVRHSGKTGPNHERQEGPHPHWVGTDRDNRFLFVPDLGSDRIVVYEMNLQDGTLKPHGEGRVPPGSGPRHLAFHPNGRFAYVANELGNTVTAFAYDAKAGSLTAIETTEGLPQELQEVLCTAAEIYIHPSGEFLYVSIRGLDVVASYRIDPATGRLTLIEREAIRGAHPRSFNIDPGGRWLLAAGRDSNTIAVFRIDEKTGGLVYNDKVVNSPSPMCIEIQAGR